MSVADVDRQMHDLQTWPAHSSSTEFSKFRSVSRSVIINIHTYEGLRFTKPDIQGVRGM